MKVLFVCKGNVARSQMAASIYNRLTNSQSAKSAGVKVTHEGETLGERRARIGGSHTLTVMQEDGYDISNNKQHQLTKGMLSKYDVVVSMHHEGDDPEWLLNSSKYLFWDVTDPYGNTLEETRKTKDLILAKVQDFVRKEKELIDNNSSSDSGIITPNE
jgi:protein-tyrosine-phosphatase